MSTHTIPKAILDQAFAWSVRLNSGEVSQADEQRFARWLAEQAIHTEAWEQVQAIEQDFSRVRQLTQSSAKTLEKVAVRRRRLKGVSAIVCVFILLGLVTGASDFHYAWHAQYATAKGEQKQLSIPGGALVYLNSQTTLDVENTDGKPLIHLYGGEIVVDSSSAATGKKPEVITQEAHFSPIGTRFVVHKHVDFSRLTVTKGIVALTTPDQIRKTTVTAGQSWQVHDGQISELQDLGLQPEAWLNHIVEADDARLGDVLEVLKPYHKGWLHYDEAVADLRVTGVFRLDDTESALVALENSLPIRIQRSMTWWVTIKIK